jgi:regulatory protein
MKVVSIKTAADRSGGGIKSQKVDSFLMRIGLSDGSFFSFKTVYLSPDFPIDSYAVIGAEISADEAVSLRYAAGCYRAERAALALIARAEQTRLGLTRKMERKGMDTAHIRAALDYLEGIGIVNDERFAELWFEAKIRRVSSGRPGKLCPRKLLGSLLGRLIPADIAHKVLKSVLDSEAERTLLSSYIAGTFPDFDKDNFSIRQKLKEAGFSSSAIRAYWEDL